jgi:hypothetical protein
MGEWCLPRRMCVWRRSEPVGMVMFVRGMRIKIYYRVKY